MNFPENMKEVSTYDVNLEKRCRFKEDVQPIEAARCDSIAKNNECFAVKSIIHQNVRRTHGALRIWKHILQGVRLLS
jgi:hypothetical protein